jgi:hypothetical protein
MAGQLYFWVGGHTGYTGQHSGYNQATNTWTRPTDGATGLSMDTWFGPYAWANRHNWRLSYGVSGQPNSTVYYTPNTTPTGLDVVVFGHTGYGAPTLTSSGASPVPVYFSCLYGGMSGDGFTASGSTAWANHGSLATEKYGQINLIFGDQFQKLTTTPSPINPLGLRTGEFGNINNPSQGFIRAYVDTASIQTRTLSPGGGSPDMRQLRGEIGIKSMGTTSTGGFFNQYSGLATDARSTVVTGLDGNWRYVYQKNGSLFMAMDFVVPTVAVQGTIENMASYSTAKVDSYEIFPTSCSGQVRIQGNPSYPVRSIKASGWVGQNTLTDNSPSSSCLSIGIVRSLLDESMPIFNVVNTFGSTGPIVRLSNAEIYNLRVDRGKVSVNSLATSIDKCIVRNGYIKNFDSNELNMEHPANQNWQNFWLGYADPEMVVTEDPGLRIEGPRVTVKCYPGQSVRTGAEGLSGP